MWAETFDANWKSGKTGLVQVKEINNGKWKDRKCA
jgi:hypothetical protein